MNLPLKFLLLIWAGWVNRAQQNAIDYLKEENRILREQVGNKRRIDSSKIELMAYRCLIKNRTENLMMRSQIEEEVRVWSCAENHR